MGCQIGMRKDPCGVEDRMRCVNWSVNWSVGCRGQKAHWVNPGCAYRTSAMCGLNHSYDNHDDYYMVYKLHFPLQERLDRCAPSWSNNPVPPPPLQEKEENHG